MQGEINVVAIMDAAVRRREWLARRERTTEWMVLKLWWADCRAERRAVTRAQRIEAVRSKCRTQQLYGPTLALARAKWRQAQAEHRRRGGYRRGRGEAGPSVLPSSPRS